LAGSANHDFHFERVDNGKEERKGTGAQTEKKGGKKELKPR